MLSRVFISGYFGFGNLGDEAILEAVVREFRRRSPHADFVIPFGADRATATRLDLQAIDFFAFDEIATEVAAADVVLFGLGGVFQDYWGADAALLFDAQARTNGVEAYARPALLATMHGVPALLFSAGVGPLRTVDGRAMFAGAARNATRLIVRDETSAVELRSIVPELEAIVAADPAFLLEAGEDDRAAVEQLLGERELAEARFVAVALRSWTFEFSDEQIASSVGAALSALPSDWRVVFVPFHVGAGTDDGRIAQLTAAATGRSAEIVSVKTPGEAIALFERAELVVAARNHAVVFAALARTPVVSLAYDPKVISSAVHAGGADFVLPFSEINRLAGILRDPAAVRTADDESLRKARSAAHSAFDLVGDGALRSEPSSSDVPLPSIERSLQAYRLQVAEKQKQIGALRADLLKRDALIESLQREFFRELAIRDESVLALQRELETLRAASGRDRDEAQRLGLALEESARQYDSAMRNLEQRTAERDRLDRQLAEVVGSKLWRVASTYWRIREKLAGRSAVPAATAARELAPDPQGDTALASTGARAPVAASNCYDVICFPIIDWDFRFQRPQQLMSQFAARGHRVFYVAQKFRQSGPAYELRSVSQNVYEVSLRGPDRHVYSHRLSDREADTFFDALNTMRRELALGATVSIIQLPFWTPIAERARSRFAWPIVYDCMDHHAGFSTNTDEMLNEEARLLRSADLVVVSSGFLDEEARKHNQNVILVRNGCDFEHFAQVQEIVHSRPVIGYYGAIADWFDADLVADLAAARPDWDFLLVGSTFTADLSRLSKLANVTLAGEKPYREIPMWLERMDVCLIPFRRIPLTEATNPVKAYEMLAGGKPVVSVPIPEVLPLAPLVRLASTAPEFEREINAALRENDDVLRERRRAFAREHTWRARYDVLAPAVGNAFPRVSIVIVTYNNVDLNRQCLESLFERNEWPNLEVFAVDNASKDETPAYLREAAQRYRDLRVILNDENRGFAAANNQALELASGDFIILLNNDTVSPRGWIAALVRHLRSDESIGMIGPSTNAIGNEAMIDVPYSDVAQMPAFAAEYMRAHDGETFDIPMLAMFCVAMRREVFQQIGLLDENFGVGMYEDDDYAHRMKLAGYRVVCARDAFVHHWMKAAFGKIPTAEYQKLFEKNRAYYEQKWGTTWKPHQRR